MLMLSLYVLIELSIEIIYPLSESNLLLLEKIDFIICIIFQIDFFYFLYHSDNKKKYLKTRWMDRFYFSLLLQFTALKKILMRI